MKKGNKMNGSSDASVLGDKKRMDRLPSSDLRGKQGKRKNSNTLVLGKKKRMTTKMKPAAAAAVLPSSRVGGKMLKKKKMMTRKQRKDEEEYHLPMHIWIQILLSLPFLSRLAVRFVCRAWNDIITRSHPHHHRNLSPAALLHYTFRKGQCPGLRRWPGGPLLRSYKTYLVLVDLPSEGEPSPPSKGVRHPCTLHECTLHRSEYTTIKRRPNCSILKPIASCHGLVCFSDSLRNDPIFVGNPLLNEELLLVPGSNTKTVMEIENIKNGKLFKKFVGFGFSPKTNSYKIMQFMQFDLSVETCTFEICTLCTGSGEPPSWKSLSNFPPQFAKENMKDNLPVGSHLDGGMHWLCYDAADDSIFISRLDLDTDKFERVQVPRATNFMTSGELDLKDMCLGVSDGYLNICANLFNEECDIWVMKKYNSWTKQFVIKSPLTFLPLRGYDPCVAVLNYAAVEAATKEGRVSEVMLMYHESPFKSYLLACMTKGGHIREVELPFGPQCLILHNPSFLSLKDAAKM